MADNGFGVISAAKSIATGLLGNGSAPYGALLLDDVFPPAGTAPLYFDGNYAFLALFVKQPFSASDVQGINDAFGDVQRWVKETYGPLRADASSTPETLHASVQPIADRVLTGIIQPLMSDDHALAGFSIFPLAAAVHLALVQELAYTDPMHPGGVDSPFRTSGQTYAQQYHDFINETWPKVMTARTNAISQPAEEWVSNYPLVTKAIWWHDFVDGTTDQEKRLPPLYTPEMVVAQATANRDAHSAAVLASLATDLGDPAGIAASFLQLVTSQLPTSAQILTLNTSGGGTVNYDRGYKQTVWSYALAWSTSGGTASLDGIGNVPASGALPFHQENSPPALPTTLTVIGPYGAATQAINWG